MMEYQNQDEQIKNRVKIEYQKSVQSISFLEESKELVFSAIKKDSYYKEILNKIALFFEYEINIPIKAYVVSALALCIIFYFMFFQPLHVSAKDVAAAKINYLYSSSVIEGKGDSYGKN